MPLLNDFLLGADPEFVMLDEQGNMQAFNGRHNPYDPWGLDHGGWVIEPHPKPDMSVRLLTGNLKVAMNDFATVAPDYKWRAGAALVAPQRGITLGGHVHVDKPRCSAEQSRALDLFTQHLEALDVLPRTECQARRGMNGGYGNFGDVRVEHGHFEYRTFASWLFSQRVTKLCLLGTKLLIVDPAAATETLGAVQEASRTRLRNFFERFQNRDDDVDWVLESGMLRMKLNVRPDRDLREVWKVIPEKEIPNWKQAHAEQQRPITIVGDNIQGGLYPYVTSVATGYFYPEGFPDRPLDIIERQAILVEMQRLGRVPGEVIVGLPVGPVRLGAVGNSFAANTPTQIVTVPVLRTPHRFRLLANQRVTAEARTILRSFVRRVLVRPGRLQLSNGLLFQYEG